MPYLPPCHIRVRVLWLCYVCAVCGVRCAVCCVLCCVLAVCCDFRAVHVFVLCVCSILSGALSGNFATFLGWFAGCGCMGPAISDWLKLR